MAVHFLTDDSKTFFDDPEKLLFRVMPLDRVIEVVEKNRWAFVSPTLWNDPFEKAFLEAEYKHQGKAFFLPLKPKKVSSELQYSLFSVCFTATRESEAFWKTYSPNGDGIRLTVKATVLKTALAKLRDYDVYIGKAVYEDYEKLYRFQKDVKFWKELQSQTINETHLKLMLKKRLPFEYENEIRIMLLRKTPMTKSVAKVSLTKANELISGIKLNPRMGTYMARMVKEIFCAKGFTADVVRKSRLYSKPESTITFKEDIDKGYEIY
jgi:hypothetical protein